MLVVVANNVCRCRELSAPPFMSGTVFPPSADRVYGDGLRVWRTDTSGPGRPRKLESGRGGPTRPFTQLPGAPQFILLLKRGTSLSYATIGSISHEQQCVHSPEIPLSPGAIDRSSLVAR